MEQTQYTINKSSDGYFFILITKQMSSNPRLIWLEEDLEHHIDRLKKHKDYLRKGTLDTFQEMLNKLVIYKTLMGKING